ncbi:MAG: MalY/PatB family protein [Anaerolineae bacterium]
MTYDFDRIIDRRHSDSEKWSRYAEDVLPLWVADMDFRAPEPVIQALHAYVDRGMFGYAHGAPDELREVIVDRLLKLYGWRVSPEALVFVTGVVVGYDQACHALLGPDDALLIQTPVYPPFLSAAKWAGAQSQEMELTRGPDGRYFVDLDRFEHAITGRTRAFLLCNPHNPVGRVFTPAELGAMAEICLRHDMYIISDEIHCDLIYSGYRHTPIASLAPEIEARTITVMAPSKTYNIPGLGCAVAIIPNPKLRQRYQNAHRGLSGHVNNLGYVAALAAYRDGQPWLDACLRYLEANRDFLHQYIVTNLPGITMSPMEGTYLAWLDCRRAGLPADVPPGKFFLEKARVALNEGATFGKGGEGFVRLNFGCPRATLEQALERMRAAL